MSNHYQHHWMDGTPVDLPVGKAVCVGRNYAAHARELGNDVPSEPLLFMKPSSAFCRLEEPLILPQGLGEVHHEVEMVTLIGKCLHNADEEEVRFGIEGYGIGLDLTLREVQNKLKEKGHPWERAKSFDGAAPLSGFIDARGVSVKQQLKLSLAIDGEIRQSGHTGLMLFPTFKLIAHISRYFTLEPGDVVFTGTPAGVGPLVSEDQLEMKLGNILIINTSVA
jgi:2-keto-4-pentenoate hydratase/2-oxohepta-3-ene-1,7-dioic acid hydratase in catechol pathway